MSKFSCVLAIAALLVLLVPARSSDSGSDPQKQLLLLETEIAQISISEKQLQDVITLQTNGDALSADEKQTLAQLKALQKRQEAGMLKDEDFDFPLKLMKIHEDEKCNAEIIQAVLVIVRTAKMQVPNRFLFLTNDCKIAHALTSHADVNPCISAPCLHCTACPSLDVQVRAQIRQVETFLNGADYARHLMEMMK
jgi:hypothetical protein